jgi:hypothetical protein
MQRIKLFVMVFVMGFAVAVSGLMASSAHAASVLSASTASSHSATSGWHYAAQYGTADTCVEAGRSSGQKWKCVPVICACQYLYHLYLWY